MSLLYQAYAPQLQDERRPIHLTYGVGDHFEGELEPAWYTGLATAPFRGAQSAWYETKSSVQVGLGSLPLDDDWKRALDTWAKENRQQASEYAMDPEMSSAAAQVVYGFSKDMAKFLPAAVGGAAAAATSPAWLPAAAVSTGVAAALYGTNVGIQQAMELEDKGVDEKTATSAGLMKAISGGVQAAMPASFGLRRLPNAMAGGGVAMMGFALEAGAIHDLLAKNGYENEAKAFDAADPVALTASGLFGGAVGAWLGRPGGRVASEARLRPVEAPGAPAAAEAEVPDAPLEVDDAARYQLGETVNTVQLPVRADDGAARQRAQEAQQAARRQVDSGNRVRVRQEAVDPERVQKIREASAKRLQEAYTTGGTVLQNRDRSSAASVAQMASIAGNPDYGRLGFSRTFTDGAPVVAYAASIPEVQRGRMDYLVAANGKRYNVQYAVVEADQIATSNGVDGTVNPAYGLQLDQPTAVAGNGRAAGLKAAYERGNADKYRAEMMADNVYGIDPDAVKDMHAPVLVRIMDDRDVTADIGDVTNQSSSAQLSVTEQAQTDAQRIDLSALDFSEDGTISPESVRQFTSLLPPEERSRLIDSSGFPTQDAQRRLDNAIFQAVYQNTGLTDLLSTTEKTGISRMVSAFRQAAPRLLQLDGTAELDFRSVLTDVLAEIQAARASGKKLSLDELAQQQAIGRSPEAEAFLKFLAKNEADGGGVRGIVDVFSELASFARQNADTFAQGDTMFGPAVEPTRVDLMREFSRLTGVPIHEADFVKVRKLADVEKKKALEEQRIAEAVVKAPEVVAAAQKAVDTAEPPLRSDQAVSETAPAEQPPEEALEGGLFGEHQNVTPEEVGNAVADMDSLSSDEPAAPAAAAPVEARRLAAPETPEMKIANAALDADPQTRIPIDEAEGSLFAAEFLESEGKKADELELEADRGVSTGVVCALLNGGLDVRE